MYNDFEDNLFGVDMRHKPPLTILPSLEHGWAYSQGRLAYSSMNRSQESNYSEYAISTMGGLPKNYIIVNQSQVKVNPETAFKVSRGRVAIPVKEYAKQRKLSLKEQWELMNPQWVGTYFNNNGFDPYRKRRPSLEEAMSEAMNNDCFDEFMSQFWSAEYGHKEALDRLTKRAKELDRRSDGLGLRCSSVLTELNNVQHDVNMGNLERYHLRGYNANELLRSLQYDYAQLCRQREKTAAKARRIREYISSITF